MKKLKCASCGHEITRKKADRRFCIECLKRMTSRDLIFKRNKEKRQNKRMKGIYAQNFYDGIFPYSL